MLLKSERLLKQVNAAPAPAANGGDASGDAAPAKPKKGGKRASPADGEAPKKPAKSRKTAAKKKAELEEENDEAQDEPVKDEDDNAGMLTCPPNTRPFQRC